MTAIGSPFAINWRDRNAVFAYARKLGHGMTVYQHPNRPNLNITFSSRERELGIHPDWVLLRT